MVLKGGIHCQLKPRFFICSSHQFGVYPSHEVCDVARLAASSQVEALGGLDYDNACRAETRQAPTMFSAKRLGEVNFSLENDHANKEE